MTSFARFAGISALLAAGIELSYAVSFIIVSRSNPHLGTFLSALFLLLLGSVSLPALVAVYLLLRNVNEGFALYGLVVAVGGAVGTSVHGAFDLATSINPPITGLATDLPSQIDPRGILTFVFSGIGLFVISWLIGKGNELPQWLAPWGYVTAALLIIIYLGRLTILTPANPVILWPVLLSGFVVYPIWYITLGMALLRTRNN